MIKSHKIIKNEALGYLIAYVGTTEVKIPYYTA